MRAIFTSFICLTVLALTACGTTTEVRAMRIPLPETLTTCTRLAVADEASLPPEPQGEEAKQVQLSERSYWMAREVAGHAVTRTNCERNIGLADLIRENNRGAE